MNVLVCVKQIPDPQSQYRLDPGDFTLDRTGSTLLDESDTFGIEMGLQLRDSAGGGVVTLVSMVANGEVTGIRNGLAMGADRAVVVSDDRLAGSDALSTAKVLAAVVRRVEPDLVIAATDSTDGYTGTVPVQIAELIGLPAVTFAKQITIAEGVLRVARQGEFGSDEVECQLPAVVTVTAGVVEPRYPSFKGIMSAKNKPLEVLDLTDLAISESEVGPAGARQRITSVERAPGRSSGDLVKDDGTAHELVVAYIEKLKFV